MSLLVEIEKRLGSFCLRVSLETEDPVTGLLGASGCGKSMTLKCIAGVERPDRGRIVLDGETLFDSEQNIDLPPQKRRVGYLFQNYALFPQMTVEQNILCGLRGEKDGEKKRQTLENALNMMRLQGLQRHRPDQLSGGQAQRVALARMLVTRPRLLLLDEPFSALDSYLRDQLQPELRELLYSVGRQTLVVTHNRDEAYHLCSRLFVMDEGHILRAGTTKEVFADPGNIAAARLTGCKNIAAARRIGEYLVEVPEWGVTFQTKAPVPDDVRAVGLRAHYFHPNSKVNRFPVRWHGEMEEPFEWVVLFRYAAQQEESQPLWWRMTKEKKLSEFPEMLGIAPENILLLR